jgi:hypothetical protein
VRLVESIRDNPKGLEFWFEASEKYSATDAPDVTVTKWVFAERDRLLEESSLYRQFVEAARNAGFPVGLIPSLSFSCRISAKR